MFDSLRGLWLGRLRIPIRRVRELIHVRRGATLAGTAAQARRSLPPEVKTPVEEHPSEAELGPRGSHTAPNGGSYPATAGREAIRAGVLRRSASAPVRLSRDGRGARPFLAGRGGRDRDRTCDPYHVSSQGCSFLIVPLDVRKCISTQLSELSASDTAMRGDVVDFLRARLKMEGRQRETQRTQDIPTNVSGGIRLTQ